MKDIPLSDKREKLRKVMICSLVESGIMDFGKAEVIFNKCFEKIILDDKESIKRLKDEFCKCNLSSMYKSCLNCRKIEKIFGDFK